MVTHLFLVPSPQIYALKTEPFKKKAVRMYALRFSLPCTGLFFFCDYQVIQIIWWRYNDDDHSHHGGEQHHPLFTSSFFLHWALGSNPKTNPSVLFHWLPFQNMYSENDASFWGNAHIIAFCLKGLPSRNDSCNDFFF